MALRLSARARLAVLHTAMVLVAGVALTVLTYFLMRQGLLRRSVLVTLDPPDGATGPSLEPPAELADRLSTQARGAALAAFPTQAALALAVVTVLAAVTSWLVAGRVLGPVRAITETALRLSAENLAERVPVRPPADELAALAVTVNGMLDRIEGGLAERDRALAGQRMFTANAAHELRTPLTTARTAVDVTLDGEPERADLVAMAQDVREAVEQCQRTLDGLLLLARSRAGPRQRRPVDLADAVARALDAAGRAVDGRVELRRDLRSAVVRGEPVLLDRMVANLVDNALRHNHAGGHVEAVTGVLAGRAGLRISNTGPPVAPDAVPALLEPFVRGEGPRTHGDGGSGLGLSIVDAVVRAHGGMLAVAARPGGGLDVSVCLDAVCLDALPGGYSAGGPGSPGPRSGP
jgi:signal transduction histidine kinase